ncbi:MAG: FtsX-like permease family protein [Clostridium sp.]
MIIIKSFKNNKVSRVILIVTLSLVLSLITSFFQLLINVKKVDIDINGGPEGHVLNFLLYDINEKNMDDVVNNIKSYSEEYDISISSAIYLKEESEGSVISYIGTSYTENPIWKPQIEGEIINNKSKHNDINIGESIYKDLKEEGVINGDILTISGVDYKIKGILKEIQIREVHVPLIGFDISTILKNQGSTIVKFVKKEKVTEDEIENIKLSIVESGANVQDSTNGNNLGMGLNKNIAYGIGGVLILICLSNLIIFINFDIKRRIKFQKVGLILGLNKRKAISFMILENSIVMVIVYFMSIMTSSIFLRIFDKYYTKLFPSGYLSFNIDSLFILTIASIIVYLLFNIVNYIKSIRVLYR